MRLLFFEGKDTRGPLVEEIVTIYTRDIKVYLYVYICTYANKSNKSGFPDGIFYDVPIKLDGTLISNFPELRFDK
jgi:hypothetical protein